MIDKSKRNPHAIYFDEPSLTKQSFKDECDINQIIDRARSGDISHVNARVAEFGDFSNVPSYRDALDLVNRSNDMFMSLDAKIRDRFYNDPARLIAFLQDPSNKDEAVKLGLVKAPEIVIPPVDNVSSKSTDPGLDSGDSTETDAPAKGQGKHRGSK